jgi:stage V sporulation protein B
MSIFRSLFLINLADLAFLVSGYLVNVLLSKYIFTPAEYGILSVVVMISTSTIIFVGDGVSKALSRFISQYPAKEKIIKRKAALIQLIMVIAVSIIYYFSVPLIGKILGDRHYVPYLQISTLIIPTFAAASFYNNYFNGLKKFHLQALQRAIRAISRVALITSLAFFFGIKGAIIGYIAAPILVFIFSFLVDKNKFKKIRGQFSYKQIIRYGIGVSFFMVAYKMFTSVDTLLVKILIRDNHWVGVYSIVVLIGQIPFYFFSSLALVLLPTISNVLEKKSLEDARKIIENSMSYITILIIPVVTSIIVFSKEIILFLSSSEYLGGEIALKFFVVGIGALTVFYICTFILNGSGNVKIPIILTWIGLVLNIILNYFIIPAYHIVGAAVATAMASTILMLASLYLTQRLFGKFLKLILILKSILAAIITAFLFSYLAKSTILLIPEGLLFIIIYLFILYLIRGITKKDILKLKNLFLKTIRKKTKRKQVIKTRR